AQALDYAKRNGQPLTTSDITFSTAKYANDTVTVKVLRKEPTVFAKVLGLGDVTIRTSASARASNLGEAQYAAPFAIPITQEQLSGPGCPCFHVPTTLDLAKVGPGAFRIINVDGSEGGNHGPGMM